MGMNAIFFFFWHGTAETLINAFYYHEPSTLGDAGDAQPGCSARSALLGACGWIREEVLSRAPHSALSP